MSELGVGPGVVGSAGVVPGSRRSHRDKHGGDASTQDPSKQLLIIKCAP